MDQLITATFSILSLCGIWWLYFIGYKQYRIDLARQLLFEVRDELFEQWVKHKLPFDSDAYKIIRSTINGTIQFAHQVSFTKLLIVSIGERKLGEFSIADRYESALSSSLEEITEDGRIAIRNARKEVHRIILRHVLLSSAGLISLALFIYAIKMLVGKFAITKYFDSGFSILDAEAVDIAESSEHDIDQALPAH